MEDNDDNCADINPKDPNRESKVYWQKIIGLAKGCFQILFPGYNIGHLQTESSNTQKTVGMQKGPV